MNSVISIPLIGLVVGLCSGWLGAYMGIRMAIVKIETWQQIADGNINRITVDVSAHRDDLLVHDMEIGDLMRDAGKERIRRQVMR